MKVSTEERLQARNDLAWSIAVGGIGIALFLALLVFAWHFAATLFLIFAGMLLGVALNAMTGLLGRLFAVAEAYPELRATENFQQLQAQLAETEQKIAISRQVYNDAVLTYDNALETVPTNIVAGVFSFKPREYFEVEEPAAREAPRVTF